MRGHQTKGVQLWTLNRMIILVACVLYAVMLFQTTQLAKRYHTLTNAADDYLLCVRKAEQLDAGSNYLTEQARLYVMNEDPSYVSAYFQEVHETRRRENALEALKNDEPGQSVVHFLDQALEYSNELMEREIYAMKLVTVAKDFPLTEFPEEIQNAELKTADSRLSNEEKIAKARRLMFNANYQNSKTLIQDRTEFCVTSVLNTVELRKSQSETALQQNIFQQGVTISLLFAVNVLTFIGMIVLVIRPLQKHIQCIQNGKPLEVVGAEEFRYLAETYNLIYEKNEANEHLLRQSAEHDGLTELFNRRVFDRLREELRECPRGIALLLLDVDTFKGVNDRYGHETGDRVLKQVASLLREHFRADDVVVRLGGDEFAVIMTRVSSDLRQVMQRKVEEINRTLQSGTDDLPPVSISAGAAFSEQGFPETLYRNADWALYATKKNGRCGCSFYEELS